MFRRGRIGRPRGVGALAFGWTPALILVLVNAVDGADKSVLAGTLSLLQDEFGFGDTIGGAIPTVDAFISAAVLIPAGYMADRYLRTRLLSIVVLSWAVLMTFNALAVAFWMFVFFRLVLGGANAIDNPAASSLLADFYPPSRRGRVFGIQRVALVIGNGVGLAVGGIVGEIFGWRAAFLALVPPALIVAVLCALLYEPARGAMDTADDDHGGADSDHDEAVTGPADSEDLGALAFVAEMEPEADPDPAGMVDEVEAGAEGMRAHFAVIRDLLRIPTVRSLYFGLTVMLLGLQGIIFWLPSFFERAHDIGEGAAGGISGGVAIITAVPGALIGGWLGDRVTRRNSGGRMTVVAFSMGVGAALLVPALLVPSLPGAVGLLAASLFTMSLAIPNFAASTADVLPAARRGTGFSLFTLMTALGGALGPFVIGGVSEATGSLPIAMVIAVIPTFFGMAGVARARHSLADDVAAARTGGG